MAVDFSRALKVKSPSKGVVTFYGLTTAPSHYVGFCSQSATRYIPMIANGGSVLFARIGGAQYGAYGTTSFNFKITYTRTIFTVFWTKHYFEKYTLNTITNSTGGVSLATTVKVRILDSSGSDVATQTFTLNANTSSQTYDTDIFSASMGTSGYYGSKIRIEVTLNGITLSFTITSLSEGQDIVTTPTRIFQFAPWIN